MNNEQAINQLKDMQSRCTNGYDAEAIYLAIKALETERPTGEWKLDSIGAYCSECKTHPDYTTNYCGNCGARMEAENEQTTN